MNLFYSKFILVTGATGFVGAHIVDEALRRGYKVRAVARSTSKAERMIQDRPQYAGSLEFTFIDDLTTPGAFDNAIKGVDGVVHVASVSLIPVPKSGKNYSDLLPSS